MTRSTLGSAVSIVSAAKLSIVVSLAIVVVVASIYWTSGSALAVTGFTANDVSITTDDGELSALTVAPEGTVDWSGLNGEADTVVVRVQVSNGSTTVTTHSEHLSVAGTSGSTTFSVDPVNTLNETETWGNTAFDTEQFSAADGSSKTTSLTVQISVVVLDSENNVLETVTEETTFDVIVTNEATALSTSGTVNTGASD